MQVSSLLQTAFMLFMASSAFRGTHWSLLLAQVFYQLRQAAMMQSLTSVWKLLKIRIDLCNAEMAKDIDVLSDPEKDTENIVVSGVGNMGDLTSETYEFCALLVLSCSGLPLRHLAYAMCFCSLVSNLMVVALSLSFRDHDIFPPELFQQRQQNVQYEDGTPAGVETRGGTQHARPLQCLAQSVTQSLCYVRGRVSYFWHAPVVKHTSMHALIVLLIYVLISTPVSNLIAQDNQDSTEDPTRENYCGGLLLSLLRQGAVLNITFFPSSLLYMFFMVHMPPRFYFPWAMAALGVLSAACMALLVFLIDTLPYVLLMVLVSVAQVVPYYLNAYDYYVLNTAIKSEYFGIILSVYAVGVQLVYLAMASVVSYISAVGYIVGGCLGLLVMAVVHAVYMRHLFLHRSWAVD
eukprot:TRINITY_DN657_c0_g1_i2.p1 TRINITY_DN657_c0_g1~~TRINITY_DN657_c0_g1_i2.p1  ORF type:complete len:406 (+),score=91.54 TRINITY_DN657_c0_g1_i2:133-1350(+)